MRMRQHQEQGKGKEDVEIDDEYFNFINSLRSKATISMYRFSLINYMKFINIKASNISSLLKQDNKKIEQ
jgi:hypothetical protein